MFALPDSWVWDFWTADDGDLYHLFFLYASRALHDPDARHFRASIGHAVSRDLVSWERVADALVRGDAPAFDDLATWTGSVVRDTDGTWVLFYTGTTRSAVGIEQTIGAATSDDLMTWRKLPGPLLRIDDRWYEGPADGGWSDETCRDPWVFADPDGEGWHMLFTGRGRTGDVLDRGVVGHGWSPDLRHWTLRPPLSAVGEGFGQLEVLQYSEIDGQGFLIFNCLANELGRRNVGGTGGIWAARAAGPLGPYAIAEAQLLTDDSLYVGKLVQRRDSKEHVFLAFCNESPDGFVGAITDPIPARVVDGRLALGGTTGTLSHDPDRGLPCATRSS